MKKNQKIDVELKKSLISDGNKLFEVGVAQGMKTFDQIITISTFAIGFLLLAKKDLIGGSLSVFQIVLILLSATSFFITIVLSIFRNYNSGYGLVFRGKRLIYEGLENYDKSQNSKGAAEVAEKKRSELSWFTRLSFFTGIGLILVLLITVR